VYMAKEETNINVDGIEELVNSSLDLAAEEMMNDSIAPENEAIESQEVADLVDEPAELESDVEIEDQEVIETQVEAEPEDKLDEVLNEANELDSNTLSDEIEPELDDQMEKDVEDMETAVEETEGDLLLTEEKELTETLSADQKDVQLESLDVLENEASELESEIQIQMDKLAEKADHLKSNIQSELQRVAENNEELQQQVIKLEQQLSDAEEKVDALAQVQDRQQDTIRKLIRILKGVNSKIADLYNEK